MLRAGARPPDACGAGPSSDAATTAPTDMQQLYATLNEYLLLEHKFQPRLCLPNDSDQQTGEVTTGARDGAAHVLRCLKVWYDLPADVLVHAINLLDRFLTKMKVRPCHVPCITVSCVAIALQHAKRQVPIEELVSISQSACTARDVTRMSSVIVDKLALVAGAATVTATHWLRLFSQIFHGVMHELPPAAQQFRCQESELMNMLEIVSCDHTCANERTSELTLMLLYHKFECQISQWTRSPNNPPVPIEVYDLYDLFAQLQIACHMSDASLVATRQLVRQVLARYEARAAAPQRQRLVWRLSERTLKVLRPTDRLTSLLPTIEEQQHFATDSTPIRNRSGSESSENEETSDWPRSPVLPVYCDN